MKGCGVGGEEVRNLKLTDDDIAGTTTSIME
jgi:hypothetical protein